MLWVDPPVSAQLEMARAPNRRPSEAIVVFTMVFMGVVFVIDSSFDEWRNAAHA